MTDTKHETIQNASHTPGPWEIQYDNADDRSGGQWYEAGPARIWFPYGSTKEQQETAEANARLIAAAPRLLHALDYLLAQTVDQDLKYGITLSEGEEDAREKALVAIAEAKGLCA